MPTLGKPQLVETESAWGAPSKRIFDELCQERIAILSALGFYEERGLPIPDADSDVTREEHEELNPIAGALICAAEAARTMPDAVLIASLDKVQAEPTSFSARKLPAEIEWAMACHYRRADENLATHWRDLWGDQLGDVEKPAESNIQKAALAAIESIQADRKRGRRPNPANQILADRLGNIFRRSGQRIVRNHLPTMRYGELTSVEVGPFYDFLNLVLKPLQRYLSENRLPPVTVASIVRYATEGSPAT